MARIQTNLNMANGTAGTSAPTQAPAKEVFVLGGDWDECQRYAKEEAAKAELAPEARQAWEPDCTCGADRTGPSAEAHKVNCATHIYFMGFQAGRASCENVISTLLKDRNQWSEKSQALDEQLLKVSLALTAEGQRAEKAEAELAKLRERASC